MSNPSAVPENQFRQEIERRKARADGLAATVRERHAEVLQAQADGDEVRAAVLFDEVERLNDRCNQALGAWLKLVLDGFNAQDEAEGDGRPPPQA